MRFDMRGSGEAGLWGSGMEGCNKGGTTDSFVPYEAKESFLLSCLAIKGGSIHT